MLIINRSIRARCVYPYFLAFGPFLLGSWTFALVCLSNMFWRCIFLAFCLPVSHTFCSAQLFSAMNNTTFSHLWFFRGVRMRASTDDGSKMNKKFNWGKTKIQIESRIGRIIGYDAAGKTNSATDLYGHLYPHWHGNMTGYSYNCVNRNVMVVLGLWGTSLWASLCRCARAYKTY